ncbi:hypothetical protein QBC34DRAFT_499350 [Podospora aff. communis PSN243]|uniref:Uncharacterized protein n=1 Tax=Podospora aff. communis PSN243 TaxID=3040156 RepID=A0AAV9G4D9_9PEZI|nr:hypothetical protein QBC34DRAFT_499350 [Podospora aff. communis PSN243]
MFDWTVPGYRAITWRPVYEAFFQEYAWECDRSGKSDMGDWSGVPAATRGDFNKFKKKAVEKVQRKKRDMESKGVKIGATHSRNQDVRTLIRPFRAAWGALWNKTSNTTGTMSTSLNTVDASIDRHLLYYPWTFPKPKPSTYREQQKSQSLESGDS